MANKKSLFVLLACALFACALAGGEGVQPGKVTTPTVPPTTPTVPPTTTAPADPTTSTTTTTTTTAAPNATTTTEAPTTTTVAPTTTAAPSTTATPPTPTPKSETGNWTVSDVNVTCILAQMAVSTKITYPTDNNQTKEIVIFVPKAAKAEGSCDSSQSIKLTWGTDKNSIEFQFSKNDTSKTYAISQITYSLYTDSKAFPNISSDNANKTIQFERKDKVYNIKLDQYYDCSREQNLTLQPISPIHVELLLSSVKLQAFHTGKLAVYGAAQECELDTPDIVPIAVGCALAALVCVVLVAYLVGRRRSQARGYLSM